MKKLLILFILFPFLAIAQIHTTTLRGVVRSDQSGEPLPQATLKLTATEFVTTSDEEGRFRFENIPWGRYNLVVSYVGYETTHLTEILTEAGKEKVLEIRLQPAGISLPVATVTGTSVPAQQSIEAITTEQTLRYAATYMDPARVTVSFPGVTVSNDQSNALVIRGNSPNYTQWRLEGVEIVNPNHLSNTGTFSDRPTTSSGSVNILSTQLLGNSYFLNGAFPAEYGNVLGGIMDMKLRTGNDEKQEYTLQASFLGLDIAAEGPFSKKSKASYLVNYRYSFTGLLGAMGMDFGGEKIKFQDLSFHIQLPTEKAGQFTFFGMGGVSNNTFTGKQDSTLWESQKDRQDIIFKNRMGATGITHQMSTGSRTQWKSSVVFSALDASRESIPYLPNERDLYHQLDTESKQLLSISSRLQHRINNKTRLTGGFFVNHQTDKINPYAFFMPQEIRRLWMLQPFIQWNSTVFRRFSSEAGLHYAWYGGLTPKGYLEPRIAFRYNPDPDNQVSLSYGLHSQLQPVTAIVNIHAIGMPNNRLEPTRAHHFVLGYKHFFTADKQLKIELYRQQLFNVPVSGGFSVLNLPEGWPPYSLRNEGKGRNMGADVSYQQYLSRQTYLLIAGSLYDARYRTTGDWHHTRYNGHHTLSITAGKEFTKKNESIWGLNFRMIWNGGLRETPIDIASSNQQNQLVYDESKPFSIQMPDYVRPDVRVYWKKSKGNYNRTLSLDLQNAANIKNVAYSYYDSYLKQKVRQYHMGIVPVLSYRWEL